MTNNVSYKFGDSEMSVSGTEEFCNKHSMMYLSMVSDKPEQLQIPFNELNIGTPELADADIPIIGDSELSNRQNTSNDISQLSLIEFYLKAPRQSHREIFLMIGAFLKDKMGCQEFTSEDLRKGYDELADIPVEPPTNWSGLSTHMKGNIEAGLIRRIDHGTYKLTIRGSQQVEQWLKAE